MVDTSAGTTTDHHQPADTSASLRVLVVDNHALVRSRMRSELTAHAPDLDIIAEADDVKGVIAAVYALRPDVVLPDIHLPGDNDEGGTEVVASCHDIPGACFLALSVSNVSDDAVGVIRTDARGCVTKAISTGGLTRTVRRMAAGDTAFFPCLAGFVLDAFSTGAGEVTMTNIELNRLSAREQEVMRLTTRGHTYKGCASELFISVKTVETHASAVLRKLQLSNRNELTRWTVVRRITQRPTASRAHPGSGSRDAPIELRPDDSPVSRPGPHLRTVPPPT